MATHDYVIDNQSAPAFRADLNSVLQAIVSNNSNATAPATTYANMFWYETDTNILWKRNEANSAWINMGVVDEGAGTFTPSGQPPTQTQATWNTGTSTTESIVSPAKLGAKVRSDLNVSGSAPMYACRAWVNFNGTGTVAIRASGNVSSITDNGTGDYTVNFTTALPTANYAALVTSIPKSAANNVNFTFGLYPSGIKTTSAVQVAIGGASNATGFTQDYDQVNVAVFC